MHKFGEKQILQIIFERIIIKAKFYILIIKRILIYNKISQTINLKYYIFSCIITKGIRFGRKV